ncbi:MAG: hypothetical protein U9O54_01450 [Chloroflexota bacterium]|nr:hypothetical protein [Chloroflexota bacterium]
MKIKNVTMARIHMPDKLVKEVDTLRLVKDQIHLICLQRRQDVGPQALARGGFDRVQNYDIEITTPAYEYEGMLEWAGRFDFSTVMVEGIRNFVPIYDARIRAVLFPNVKIKSPAVLFNRKQVATLLALQQA